MLIESETVWYINLTSNRRDRIPIECQIVIKKLSSHLLCVHSFVGIHKMVTKMNEPATTVIETLTTSVQQQHTNSAVVTITLHPQPNANERENCDNISSITSDTTTALSNASPTSCESDSIERSQALIKKSLKLDLTHSNNDTIEDDTINRRDNDEDVIESPTEKEDLSFKSPTSPKSPRGNGKMLIF